MEYVFMGISAVVIIIALMYFKKHYFSKGTQVQSKKQSSPAGDFANCPVCTSPILPGQNVRSKIFVTSNQNDQLCYVYGCSNCYPKCKPALSRTCPVCHKKLDNDGYLLSRIFNKTKSGKPHVIINGCVNCNRHK